MKNIKCVILLLILTACHNNDIEKPIYSNDEHEYKINKNILGSDEVILKLKLEEYFLIALSVDKNQKSRYYVFDLKKLNFLFSIESPINKYYLEAFTFSKGKLYCQSVTGTSLYTVNISKPKWQSTEILESEGLFFNSIYNYWFIS